MNNEQLNVKINLISLLIGSFMSPATSLTVIIIYIILFNPDTSQLKDLFNYVYALLLHNRP